MPTPYGGEPRRLQFPLNRVVSLLAATPDDPEPCGIPTFPDDADEKTTVLFRLSLNEYVALASCVDVGRDIAYGSEAVFMWWLWSTSVMCASFCDEVALCLTLENPAVVEALSQLIQNNPTIINAISSSLTEAGTGVPGQPLTASQAGSSVLPPNVKNEDGDCILDALWGGCLFLVQSGNRLITDFFEKLESVSNTLETSAIVAETIPAAGPYVSAAAEFADQLQENLSEGYAAAYTEDYEEELACALFCLAKDACALTPDDLMDALAERLGYVDGTENYGVLMARVGTGVFIGNGIADAMFYIYFAALRFGQQFMDQLGIRPMTDLMGLGADQLASDNWETLCECATAPTFTVTVNANNYTPTDAGHAATPGDVWRFTVPGTWNAGIGDCDADGNPGTANALFWDPSSNAGALVGKWDSESTWFLVGTTGDFTVPVGATALALICNDVASYPPSYADNSGSLTASVEINP